jgi:thiol-disulfide isomerase/thioredoxin
LAICATATNVLEFSSPEQFESMVVPLAVDTELPLINNSNETGTLEASYEGWFVKFYAPWCSHCQEFAPTWEEFADEMGDMYGVGAVNCTENLEFCAGLGVTGYPTLRFYYDPAGDYVKFSGARTLKELMRWADSEGWRVDENRMNEEQIVAIETFDAVDLELEALEFDDEEEGDDSGEDDESSDEENDEEEEEENDEDLEEVTEEEVVEEAEEDTEEVTEEEVVEEAAEEEEVVEEVAKESPVEENVDEVSAEEPHSEDP